MNPPEDPRLAEFCHLILDDHFPPETVRRLASVIGPGRSWVTDADGTLWRDDIGEAFLRWLAKEGALVSPEARDVDVWESYLKRVEADPLRGYLWAVQIMAGMREAELEELADTFAGGFVMHRLFAPMMALHSVVESAGMTDWIVSASNDWVIRGAAKVLGIPLERVRGIRLQVVDGVLTDRPAPPVTWRLGKAIAARNMLGARPCIVSGDTMGDLELLCDATGLSLVIQRPNPDPAFLDIARERDFHVVSFPGWGKPLH